MRDGDGLHGRAFTPWWRRRAASGRPRPPAPTRGVGTGAASRSSARGCRDRRRSGNDPPDLAVLRAEIELARRVLAETEDVGVRAQAGPLLLCRDTGAGIAEAPHPARAVVGVEIAALEPGHRAAAIHVPADHAA